MSSNAIDFYFDFSSPYGYLASRKIEALAARHGRGVRWHPMLLGVVFKQTGGAPLTEVPVKGPYSKRDFARSARFHGIEFAMPPVFPIASQAPARMVLWAAAQDAAAAARMTQALYRAYFIDGRDISKADVAAEVAGKAGFDAAAARAAVDDQGIKDALKREVESAIAAGVFGSPFVIVDGEPFWGLDRFDQLDRWLGSGGF
ncbi:MAG: 2-hydroxychromene-2-carboxylate isomerase [Betaproteobacteria bacterium]